MLYLTYYYYNIKYVWMVYVFQNFMAYFRLIYITPSISGQIGWGLLYKQQIKKYSNNINVIII